MDRDDWGTLALLNAIEGSGRAWNEVHSIPRAGIGDLSLQEGGPFTRYGNPDILDHHSHQNGLDVDMRFVKNNGTEGPLNLVNDPELYDPEATQYLIDQIITNGDIFVIYVNVALSGLEGSVVVNDNSHVDHFHVRIVDPDGTGN